MHKLNNLALVILLSPHIQQATLCIPNHLNSNQNLGRKSKWFEAIEWSVVCIFVFVLFCRAWMSWKQSHVASMKFSIHCNYSQLNEHSINCYLIIILLILSVYAQIELIKMQYGFNLNSRKSALVFFFYIIYVGGSPISRWFMFSASIKMSCFKCLLQPKIQQIHIITIFVDYFFLSFEHLHEENGQNFHPISMDLNSIYWIDLL